MTVADWTSVIDQAAALGAHTVQFIGGEPTLHPGLADLVVQALEAGLRVEVYSNLVHVPTRLWPILARPGASVATSFYTDDRDQHAQITGRDTLRQTMTHILTALSWGIPVRVGMVDGIIPGQRTEEGRAALEGLGVPPEQIRVDRMRLLGRPALASGQGDMGELCGQCGRGTAAVLPDGTVAPCIMSRWLNSGNVRDGLGAALEAIGPHTAAIAAAVASSGRSPEVCDPRCGPSCSPACSPQGRGNPCTPRGGCNPNYGCNPDRRLCDPDRSCRPNKCRPTG